jgi:polar amino acid transport system substrate-binding protein
MIMKKMFATVILAALLFLPGIALAEKVLFVSTDWPPYVMSENGKPSGIDTEIVLELCKRLGIEADIQVLPWKRALKNVEKGEADAIFAVRHNEERAAFLYYPSEPLNIEKTVIIAGKGSGIKVTGLDDLKGKSVGTVRGYTYDPKFDTHKEIEKIDCNDDAELVKVFTKGRVPLAASCDEITLKYLCKKAGVETETVYVLNETPSYIGFSKAKGEKGKSLCDKFSEALRQLKKEGFIEKVQSKYF